MPLDHDQHGDAAQPVEIWAPARDPQASGAEASRDDGRRRCRARYHRGGSARPSSTCRATARWRARRRRREPRRARESGARLRDASRSSGCALGGDRRAKRGERMASLPDDVDDIDRHAAGQGDRPASARARGRRCCRRRRRVAIFPLVAPKRSSSAQTSSAVTGGLAVSTITRL